MLAHTRRKKVSTSLKHITFLFLFHPTPPPSHSANRKNERNFSPFSSSLRRCGRRRNNNSRLLLFFLRPVAPNDGSEWRRRRSIIVPEKCMIRVAAAAVAANSFASIQPGAPLPLFAATTRRRREGKKCSKQRFSPSFFPHSFSSRSVREEVKFVGYDELSFLAASSRLETPVQESSSSFSSSKKRAAPLFSFAPLLFR